VSIPDDVYAAADRVAGQKGMNRSALYTRALRRLLADEGGDELTRRIDATCEEMSHDDLTAVARVDMVDTGAWAW
jgi:metal-responsive CopG/Arc/MetJ family transcriptional regulator